MSAAEDPASDFGSMTNDSAATVAADWSKRLNCTLEAVKNMTGTTSHYFEAFVVVIPTDFTLGHSILHGFWWDSGALFPVAWLA